MCMAKDLLLSLSRSLDAVEHETTTLIEHEAHHDTESSFRVLIYSLIRRLLETDRRNMNDKWKKWMKGLRGDFNEYFGEATLDSILAERLDSKP
ncbi:hypothetical protein OBBRIDRAFT_794622 [Obba rivulosa]|uniref:Uncharacterized protein n=1 Tax=Obba rivulosa TaxID=1052685 RepID=A0A8E2B0Q8_9APHY|nr:hypothetical protein OBBRIDRAFT_794622 [Obba rivulosa]